MLLNLPFPISSPSSLSRKPIFASAAAQAAIERQHAKGRLTARERIAKLIDPGTPFFELGLWAAWEMYAEWGGAPAAGVVTGIGTIAGRRHMIIANDATVKAGAFFPATAKKVLRAQRIALQNRLPLVYLVDSAGVFLPLQEDVFPDEDDFGRIFRNNAVISAAGLGQIAAIMGNCVAGGGYLPVLCDKLLMTEGSGLYLAGPALVKSAIGQEVSHEELGGAAMHAADQRHDRLSRPERRSLPRAAAPAGRRWCGPTTPQPPAAVSRATRPIAAARPGTDLYDLVEPRSARRLRSPRRARLPRRCRQLRRVQGRVRPDRSSAARRASAAFRSASSPTSTIACARPTGRFNSAACCTSTAPTRPPAS